MGLVFLFVQRNSRIGAPIPNWRLLALAWLAALPACVTEEGSVAPRTTPAATYSDLSAQDAALHAQWDGAGYTPPSGLPLSGAASYAGVIGLQTETVSADLALSGVLRLDVNFLAGSLSGSATSFVDQNDTAYGGTLTIANGVLDRTADPVTGFTFSATVSGAISGGGENFAITADLNGDFLGPAHNAVTGPIAGSASGSVPNGYLFGDFIAAR